MIKSFKNHIRLFLMTVLKESKLLEYSDNYSLYKNREFDNDLARVQLDFVGSKLELIHNDNIIDVGIPLESVKVVKLDSKSSRVDNSNDVDDIVKVTLSKEVQTLSKTHLILYRFNLEKNLLYYYFDRTSKFKKLDIDFAGFNSSDLFIKSLYGTKAIPKKSTFPYRKYLDVTILGQPMA